MAEIIIYNTEDGQANIKLYATDGTVWLNLKWFTFQDKILMIL